MNARSYAGGNWKDAQKAAEHYWRETKGGFEGSAPRGALRGLPLGWRGLLDRWQSTASARPRVGGALGADFDQQPRVVYSALLACSRKRCAASFQLQRTQPVSALPNAGRTQEGYEDFINGVWRNYQSARDSAGWTWDEAQVGAARAAAAGVDKGDGVAGRGARPGQRRRSSLAAPAPLALPVRRPRLWCAPNPVWPPSRACPL